MRWLLIALGTLIALLLVVYFWPVPAKSFAELAEKVDPATRQSLLAFRAQHPEKTVVVDGREWRYIAFGEHTAARAHIQHAVHFGIMQTKLDHAWDLQ